METTARNYSLIATALAIACLVSGYLVFTNFWPSYNAALTANAQAVNDRQQLKDTLDSVKVFVKTFEAQSSKMALTTLALPPKSTDMANFTSNLAQLAQSSGIALSSLQVLESGDAAGAENSIDYQNLTLGISGTYPAFQEFLRRVEANLRLIDIFHVTVAAKDANNPVLSYQIQMRVYYQK